jgi:hypothetical protein
MILIAECRNGDSVVPSSRVFALVTLIVQRVSRSLWRNLAGCSKDRPPRLSPEQLAAFSKIV